LKVVNHSWNQSHHLSFHYFANEERAVAMQKL